MWFLMEIAQLYKLYINLLPQVLWLIENFWTYDNGVSFR